MKRQLVGAWIFLIAAVFFVGACGGGSGGGSSSNDSGTGTLAVNLVDAPGSNKAVYVTIKEVQVCAAAPSEGDGDDDCEWLTVGTPEKTYNLLELVNGAMEELGQEDLSAGTYNQMRLLLSDVPDTSMRILLRLPIMKYLKLNSHLITKSHQFLPDITP